MSGGIAHHKADTRHCGGQSSRHGSLRIVKETATQLRDQPRCVPSPMRLGGQPAGRNRRTCQPICERCAWCENALQINGLAVGSRAGASREGRCVKRIDCGFTPTSPMTTPSGMRVYPVKSTDIGCKADRHLVNPRCRARHAIHLTRVNSRVVALARQARTMSHLGGGA